jgi:hypothetical protein
MEPPAIEPPAPRAWVCDICGDEIPEPGVGLITWLKSDDRPMYDFKIVHKNIEPWRCWDRAEAFGHRASYELYDGLGLDGLTTLLSWLTYGPVDGGGHPDVAPQDLDGYVDLVRRLQLPYYEQARLRFGTQDVHERLVGVNPAFPYIQESLQWAARQPIPG